MAPACSGRRSGVGDVGQAGVRRQRPKHDLLQTLQRYREVAETKRQELRAIFHEYLRGEEPFPERVHINVVAYRLLWETTETKASWADWAIDQVERWSDDLNTPPDRQAALDVLDQALASGRED